MPTSKQHWFWAYVVEMTAPKQNRSESTECEVWRNLILIRASDAETAYEKAVRIGELGQGDAGGSLTLDGNPAMTTFIGVGGMGLIHDAIKDGCEVLWNLERCKYSAAFDKIKKKEELIASAKKELTYYNATHSSAHDLEEGRQTSHQKPNRSKSK